MAGQLFRYGVVGRLRESAVDLPLARTARPDNDQAAIHRHLVMHDIVTCGPECDCLTTPPLVALTSVT